MIGIGISALFLAVRLKWTSKIINTIAGLSLFVYLIHGNYFWQAYGKYYVHQRLYYFGIGNVNSTLVLFVITVVSSIILAYLYKVTIGFITGKLSSSIGAKIMRTLKLDS